MATMAGGCCCCCLLQVALRLHIANMCPVVTKWYAAAFRCPTRSVVKGIFPYPQWDMLVVATSLNPNMRISLTGKDLGLLSVMRMPTEQQLTSELKRHQFLAAPSSTVLPTVDLPTYVHGGHMQNIEAAVCLVSIRKCLILQ